MAAERSMPPVPIVSGLPANETGPAGSTIWSPRTEAFADSVTARLAVEAASNRAVSAAVGTAAFQLVAVCQTASVAPVQVWVAAVTGAARPATLKASAARNRGEPNAGIRMGITLHWPA